MKTVQGLIIIVSEKKPPQPLPRQKEQTCLAACLKLARPGTEQSHPSPASAPPASWLCSHTPAEPSQCSVVSAWKSERRKLYFLLNAVTTGGNVSKQQSGQSISCVPLWCRDVETSVIFNPVCLLPVLCDHNRMRQGHDPQLASPAHTSTPQTHLPESWIWVPVVMAERCARLALVHFT